MFPVFFFGCRKTCWKILIRIRERKRNHSLNAKTWTREIILLSCHVNGFKQMRACRIEVEKGKAIGVCQQVVRWQSPGRR